MGRDLLPDAIMRTNSPSRTAQFVALGRAMADIGLSHVPDFHDPTARVFLNERGTKSLAKIENAVRDGKRRMQVEAARGMADMMALRTTAIDHAVRDSIALGANQLVILGAGYDGRAWRMSELAGIKVFEVDYPSTQKEKNARIAELSPPVGDVNFVSIDFEHDSLDTVLEDAGHDTHAPTCWIWEGVVMYLTQDAFRGTLAAIATRSTAGSTLIVNYHAPHGGVFGKLILRLIGEPQINSCTAEEMSVEMRSVGFVVRDDSSMLDWNDRYAGGQGRVRRGYYMRIAVADKL